MFRPKIQLYTVHLTSLSTTPSVSNFQSAVYLASLSNGPGSFFKKSSTTRRIYVWLFFSFFTASGKEFHDHRIPPSAYDHTQGESVCLLMENDVYYHHHRRAHTPFHRQGMPANYPRLIKEGNMLRQTTCHHRHTTAKTSLSIGTWQQVCRELFLCWITTFNGQMANNDRNRNSVRTLDNGIWICHGKTWLTFDGCAAYQ